MDQTTTAAVRAKMWMEHMDTATEVMKKPKVRRTCYSQIKPIRMESASQVLRWTKVMVTVVCFTLIMFQNSRGYFQNITMYKCLTKVGSCKENDTPWHFTVRTLSKSDRFRTRKHQNDNISSASILMFSRSKTLGLGLGLGCRSLYMIPIVKSMQSG